MKIIVKRCKKKFLAVPKKVKGFVKNFRKII